MRRGLRAIVIAALISLAPAAGLGVSAGAAATAGPTGTVTFAQSPATTPNYIFPLAPAADFYGSNYGLLQPLLFRPLYWFGNHGRPTIDYRLSLAGPPTTSADGRTATITLKPYRWADGQPVTARDVQFWINLVIANKDNWEAYVPGEFPDNVSATRVLGARTISITFNRRYSSYWLLYNELSQIYPIPQHAWDKTSASGPVGNYDLSHRGAVAVYSFLDRESKDLATWTTDPLWRVVDGPWRLASFDSSTGYIAFVPNPEYSGPMRPTFARFEEIPFTSDTAEYDSLLSGALDYGYLPVQDLDQRSLLARKGFHFEPWPYWGITFLAINFTNPTDGPVFRQLYVRQAMQHLVDQAQIIRSLFAKLGYPTYGPVPLQPNTPFISPAEHDNPYPYDPALARHLLAAHGWSVHPGGTSVCRHPGAGPTQCGAGVHRGARMAFHVLYVSGTTSTTSEMEALRSEFLAAGIQLTLSSGPFGTVLGDATPCKEPKSTAGCAWDMAYWGPGSWTYEPDYYPTGDEIFTAGSPANSGGYDNPTNQANVRATTLSAGLAPEYRYENYLAKDLPVLWLPNSYYQLSEVRDTLHGTEPQTSAAYLAPEAWTLSR